jgi:hypothetical protein
MNMNSLVLQWKGIASSLLALHFFFLTSPWCVFLSINDCTGTFRAQNLIALFGGYWSSCALTLLMLFLYTLMKWCPGKRWTNKLIWSE